MDEVKDEQETTARIPFRPLQDKLLVEIGTSIRIDKIEGDVITQREIHKALGAYFMEHGKYPEKVLLSPEQFLHFRAALGLWGNVEKYEYMEFIFEPTL